jgi:hypothetical protein
MVIRPRGGRWPANDPGVAGQRLSLTRSAGNSHGHPARAGVGSAARHPCVVAISGALRGRAGFGPAGNAVLFGHPRRDRNPRGRRVGGHRRRVGTTRAGTLEDAGPLAADMVAARLGVDPATVRVVVRARLSEEIADAIEFVDLIHRFTSLAARAMACVRELAAGGRSMSKRRSQRRYGRGCDGRARWLAGVRRPPVVTRSANRRGWWWPSPAGWLPAVPTGFRRAGQGWAGRGAARKSSCEDHLRSRCAYRP